IDRAELRRAFRAHYGREPRLFRAPGRVNLIGEHTDYNGGFVLPMALDRETVVAAAARTDARVLVRSLNENESAEFDLESPGPPRRGHWLDYVEGVARALIGSGFALAGAELMILSDVPAGAGLSSSAALEISAGLALASLAGAEVDRVTLALAGQQAEHEYVGTMCGIMDQFVAAMAREGAALLIDCRTLEATPVPLDTREAAVVVCDTRVRHELSTSEYNTRRRECERGVELLGEFLPGVTQLRDVSAEDFRLYEARLPEPIRRRCRHVVTEDERTLAMVGALGRGDLAEAGRLMYASHESLRRDYEVSCRELDELVSIARALGGVVFGARMTGGGFGGSTVNLVRRAALDEFTRTVSADYERAVGVRPAVYVSEPGGGAEEVTDS
ncbi:MAG TPA: galactokinase, partial [Pyrinomonadaceae bacterium]